MGLVGGQHFKLHLNRTQPYDTTAPRRHGLRQYAVQSQSWESAKLTLVSNARIRTSLRAAARVLLSVDDPRSSQCPVMGSI